MQILSSLRHGVKNIGGLVEVAKEHLRVWLVSLVARDVLTQFRKPAIEGAA